jgi:hypothetical protein
MERCMQEFSTTKEKKAHLHDPSNSGSTNKSLPCRHPQDPWCHQSIGRRPGKSGVATCVSHGSYGPPTRPKCLKSTWAPRTALRTHLPSTWRKHSIRGPTYGLADLRSAELPLAWLILAFHVWAPGWSLLHSRGARGFSQSCLAPINRREWG